MALMMPEPSPYPPSEGFSPFILRDKSKACRGGFKKCLLLPSLTHDNWLEQRSAEFNWWTSGLNVDKNGPGSLDSRLRLRPDITTVIVDALDGLEDALCTYYEIAISGPRPSLEDESLDLFEADDESASPDGTGRAPSPWSDMSGGSENEYYSAPGDGDDDSETSENGEYQQVEDFKETGENASPCLDAYHEQRVYIKNNLELLISIHTAIKRSGLKLRNQRADDALKQAEDTYQRQRKSLGAHQALESEAGQHERFRRYLTMLVLSNGYTEFLMQRVSVKIYQLEETHGSRDFEGSRGIKSKESYETLLQKNVLIVLRAFLRDPARLNTVQRRLIEANVVRRNRLVHAGRAEKTLPYAQEGSRRALHDKPSPESAVQRSLRPENIGSIAANHLMPSTTSQPATRPNPNKNATDSFISQPATALRSNFSITGALTPPSRSTTMSAATKMSARVGQLDYPSCPSKEGPFPCSYCPMILSQRYTKKETWRGHIAQDLCGYVCVFEDCESSENMFSSTYEWMSHMVRSHSEVEWVCPKCVKYHSSEADNTSLPLFSTAWQLKHHILANHPSSDPAEPDMLVDAGKRVIGIQKVKCPLCRPGLVTSEAYESVKPPLPGWQNAGLVRLEEDQHIATHIHEFALHAFPSPDNMTPEHSLVSLPSDPSTREKITFQGPESPEGSRQERNFTYSSSDIDDMCEQMKHGLVPRFSQGVTRSLLQRLKAMSVGFDDTTSMFGAWRDKVDIEAFVLVLNECRVLVSQLWDMVPSSSGDDQQVLELLADLDRCLGNLYSITLQGAEEARMASGTHQYQLSPTAPSNTLAASFTNYVSSNVKIGYSRDGRETEFMPPAKLRTYWTHNRIAQVLREHAIHLDVRAIRDRYLRVFSTLVYISQVQCLNAIFTKYDLNDDRFPEERCPWVQAPALSHLWDLFSRHQWTFFPLVIQPHRLLGTTIPPERILPWKKYRLRGGDTSTVWKIEIQESCNMLQQRHQGSTTSKQNTFALKTYTEKGANLYENERKAFEVLSINPSDHIVACYGAFQQMGTYNLILELANGGDLLDYFKATQPPRSAREIYDFWGSLTDIFKGLFRVHQLTEHDELANKGRLVHIFHEDLTPENILLHRPENSDSIYKFLPKIADFGHSNIHNIPPDSQDKTLSINRYSNPRYSAPEISYPERYMQVGRYRMSEFTDIWAIGCILSEAAVWLALGPNGRHIYDELRGKETNRIRGFAGSAYRGCFHNGTTALTAVGKMHRGAIEALPSCDDVTKSILELVEQSMLASDPKERWAADKIKSKIGHILDGCRKPGDDAVSNSGAENDGELLHQPSIAQPQSVISNKRQPKNPSDGAPGVSAVTPPSLQIPVPSSVDSSGELPSISLSLRPANVISHKPNPPPPTSPGPHASMSPTSAIHKPVPESSGRKTDHTRGQELAAAHFLSLQDVAEYRKAEKKGVSPGQRIEALVRQLQGSLQLRDHLFFVEDSQSMKYHQADSIRAFKSLSYLAKRIDTNGIELILASNPSIVHHNSNTTPLIAKLERCGFNNISLMEHAMGAFVDEVVIPRLPKSSWPSLNDGRRASFSAGKKPISIFVFTDGRWGDGLPDAAGVENPVKRLMKKIHELGLIRTYIMLQFIRFGDHADGKRYLQFLDDFGQKTCDIVDTEPIDGNVFKIFIGSLNSGMDNTPQHRSASTAD